jgi:shikimate dehydrogenase
MSHFYTLEQVRAGLNLNPPARLAVIGDPIEHSKSPQMHNPALQADGKPAQYVRVKVPVGCVAEAFRTLQEAGFWGVNITIPHKFEALDAVDVLDPLAQKLGAVNTLRYLEDGRMAGFNSDGPGFIESVKEAFHTEIYGLRVLILGAGGGAGRAVAVQSALSGAKSLYLVNRTQEKAAALATELQGQTRTHVVEWTDAALAEVLPKVDLIVNGTSLGMKAGDAPLLPVAQLEARHRVFDMVYRAGGKTWLGQAAASVGAAYVDGLTLLLHQGAISYQKWFEHPAPLDVMRAGLAEAAR